MLISKISSILTNKKITYTFGEEIKNNYKLNPYIIHVDTPTHTHFDSAEALY